MKRHSRHRRRGPALMVLKCAVWLALGALVVALVMMLWNWLMPALFTGARVIDYWQALALIVLCRILFGGGGRWKRHRHHHRMDPDERERFRRHFGREGYASTGATPAPGEPQ